jgi:hypothetical protein
MPNKCVGWVRRAAGTHHLAHRASRNAAKVNSQGAQAPGTRKQQQKSPQRGESKPPTTRAPKQSTAPPQQASCVAVIPYTDRLFRKHTPAAANISSVNVAGSATATFVPPPLPALMALNRQSGDDANGCRRPSREHRRRCPFRTVAYTLSLETSNSSRRSTCDTSLGTRFDRRLQSYLFFRRPATQTPTAPTHAIDNAQGSGTT